MRVDRIQQEVRLNAACEVTTQRGPDLNGEQGATLNMSDRNLPPEIKLEAAELLDSLAAQGWRVSASMYEATFSGDWFVDLCKDEKCIRLMKESEMFTLQALGDVDDVDPEVGAEAESFDNFASFQEAVAQWSKAPKHASLDTI